ncbi:hypothetical protein [Methanococcus aeolicus]|uniref:hypothetical protein n=1 Tax=Methanococcus aeolicus TaxID=42879 RepID=UPI0012F64A49|nr:hypothetical protein [Methanococcus aeolicus]
MSAFDLGFLLVAGASLIAGSAVMGMKVKDTASSVYHERHQDNKIKEHDMKLSHVEAKNK